MSVSSFLPVQYPCRALGGGLRTAGAERERGARTGSRNPSLLVTRRGAVEKGVGGVGRATADGYYLQSPRRRAVMDWVIGLGAPGIAMVISIVMPVAVWVPFTELSIFSGRVHATL